MAGITELQAISAGLFVKIMRPDWPSCLLVEGMDLSDSTGCNEPVSDNLRHRVRPRPDRTRISVLKNGLVSVFPHGFACPRVDRRDDILRTAPVCGVERRPFDGNT